MSSTFMKRSRVSKAFAGATTRRPFFQLAVKGIAFKRFDQIIGRVDLDGLADVVALVLACTTIVVRSEPLVRPGGWWWDRAFGRCVSLRIS